MSRRVIVVLVMAALAALAYVPGRTVAADAPRVEQPGTAKERERLQRDLDALADAWALGGGTFGFPFWEKAGQRWRTGQVTTPLYREYVTGYRDRLQGGCELLSAVDVDRPESRDVKELVVDSCTARLRALRAQQAWLDTLIELDHAESTRSQEPVGDDAGRAEDAGDDEAAAAAEAAQELQVEAADHEQEFRERIQESFRDARLAMDLAQRELDTAGLDRLAEDAFI